MKTILLICPTKRDYRELSHVSLSKMYSIIFQPWDKVAFDQLIFSEQARLEQARLQRWPEPGEIINSLVELSREWNVDGVVSTNDYPGNIFASIVAQRCDLIGPVPESVLRCHHKYYSRVNQAEHVPEATPTFSLLDATGYELHDSNFDFPVFVKPVKSFFSVYAQRIDSADELKQYIKHAQLPDIFLRYFNWSLKQYGSFAYDSHYFLAEELLEGEQVTVEGYAWNGNIEILGVVDSVMFPGTICFQRFDYPSRLSASIQKRMASIAKRSVAGIGLDNTLFNIECIYNPQAGTIHVIEINSRMSSQFADLFEKVDGINTYEIMLKLAAGQKPIFLRRQGQYAVAASFVLRTFEDKRVIRMPSKEQIERVLTVFPEARLEMLTQEGQRLSSLLQDEFSYRYGLIHLGGADWNDLFEKYKRCLDMLEFVFEPA